MHIPVITRPTDCVIVAAACWYIHKGSGGVGTLTKRSVETKHEVTSSNPQVHTSWSSADTTNKLGLHVYLKLFPEPS